MRRKLSAGVLALASVLALVLVQLGAPRDAQSLSCAPSASQTKKPLPPAQVFSVSLSASTTELDAPASVDLRGRYSYAICTGVGPAVKLESRVGGGEFAPARGVGLYRRGTAFICTVTGQPPPGPAGFCGVSWGTEDAVYVAAPAETTEFRLRAGPRVSEPVLVTVMSPRPELRCDDAVADVAQQQLLLQLRPERRRIGYGDSVRVAAGFGFELCGRLLRPDARPGLESRWAGARYTNQPAEHVRSGPDNGPDGELVYELAPPATTSYRLYYAGDFGAFATIEVTPRLELTTTPTTGDNIDVRVQARASALLRGVPVRIERHDGSRWKLLRSVVLNADLGGAASIPAHAARGEVRASIAASRHHTAAVSPTLVLSGTSAP